MDDQPDEFTGPWLRELLDRKRVVRGRHKPPSPKDCDSLADSLNAIRRLRAAEARRRTLAEALRVLAAALPCEKEYLADVARSYRDGAVPAAWPLRLEHHIATLDALAAGVDAAQRLGVYVSPTKEAGPWYDLACHLSAQFCQALKMANPGLQLGLSNDGPVARYVAAVLPYVTGEAPAVETVARHLQRQEAIIRKRMRAFKESGMGVTNRPLGCYG